MPNHHNIDLLCRYHVVWSGGEISTRFEEKSNLKELLTVSKFSVG
jgi:hypothetical protein